MTLEDMKAMLNEPEDLLREYLSNYLNTHLDGYLDQLIGHFFNATPFITDVLKIFFQRFSKLSCCSKILELLHTYNLARQIRGVGLNQSFLTANLEIKGWRMLNCQAAKCLVAIWRKLYEDILAEFSQLAERSILIELSSLPIINAQEFFGRIIVLSFFLLAF
jgi:hypothetical protein